MKLNIKAFGLTCGIMWGLSLFLLTWMLIAMDGTTDELTFIGRFYLGYSVTVVGSFIGLIWATVDGFIGGVIFAWLYNLIVVRISQTETTTISSD